MTRALLLVALLTVDAAGCSSGMSGEEIALQFRAVVGDQPFACTTTYTVGTAATEWAPVDFRLYVHGLRAVAADGTEAELPLVDDGVWQALGVALLDFEDKQAGCRSGTVETNDRVRVRLPAGAWTGLALTLGIPFALNHLDLVDQPSPLNLGTLYWGWAGGYKFMRIDGRAGAAGAPTFLTHIGSTGCTMENGTVTGCARPNRAQISLPFPSAGQAIVVDLAALLAANDVGANLTKAPPGCMSDVDDPDCAGVFEQLGLGLADGTPSGTQRFLSVR